MTREEELRRELRKKELEAALAQRPAQTPDYPQLNALQRGMGRSAIGLAQALGMESALGGTPEQAAMAAQEINRQGEGTGVGGLVGEIAGDPRAWLAGLAAPVTAPMAATPQGRAILGGAYGATEPVTTTGNEAMQDRAVNTAMTAGAAAITPWAMNKIGGGVKNIAGKVGAPKAAEFLKKQFTPQDIEKAIGRIEELQKIGVKAPLATVAPESIFQIASTRAQTLAGANVAKKSLEDVATQIARAESDLISNLATTSKSALSDAEVFKTSATSIKNAIVDARRAKANVLYGAIAEKKIPPALYKNIVNNNPIIASKIAKAESDPVIKSALMGAKPNSVEYLDRIKRLIDVDINTAKRGGGDVATYMKEKNNLVQAVESYVPSYKDARFAFEQDSAILDKFVGGKKGAINQILNLADEDATKAYSKIFSLQPEQIDKMRRTFEKLGQRQAFTSLSRGYLTQKLVKAAGSQAEGKVTLSKVLNNQIDRDRISAAIGDKNKLALFNRVLQAQDDVLNNAKQLAPRTGSPTFARTATQEQLNEEGLTRMGRVAGGVARSRQKVAGLLGFNAREIKDISQNEAFYTELQKILFEPSSGAQFLRKYSNKKTRDEVIGEVYQQAVDRAGITAGATATLEGVR